MFSHRRLRMYFLKFTSVRHYYVDTKRVMHELTTFLCKYHLCTIGETGTVLRMCYYWRSLNYMVVGVKVGVALRTIERRFLLNLRSDGEKGESVVLKVIILRRRR